MANRGDRVNARVRKGYGKAGKKLGHTYEVYRPTELDEPIQSANYLDTKEVAFSLDQKFSKAPDQDKMYVYYCWIDARLEENHELQRGDILYRSETGDTWIVATVDPIEPVMAFKAKDTVSVYSVVSSNTGSRFSRDDKEEATDVPCYIDVKNPSGSNLGFVPGPTYGRDSYSFASIYLWDPDKEIQRGWNIVDQLGNRWEVQLVEETPIGTRLEVQQDVEQA